MFVSWLPTFSQLLKTLRSMAGPNQPLCDCSADGRRKRPPVPSATSQRRWPRSAPRGAAAVPGPAPPEGAESSARSPGESLGKLGQNVLG